MTREAKVKRNDFWGHFINALLLAPPYLEESEPKDPDFSEELSEKIAEALAESDLLYCSRVWESWSYGTMGEDDFGDACDDPDIVNNFVEKLTPFILEQIGKNK